MSALLKNCPFAVIVALIVAGGPRSIAQQIFPDTIRLDMSAAERQFISRNASLIAKKFGIEENRANKLQVSLWDNPSVSLEQNIYNRETGKFFPNGRDGQIAFEIKQLLDYAGKRGKRVHIEAANEEIAQLEFYDLIRTLRFELRTTFYDLYFLQQTLKVYEKEIVQMRTTVELLEAQYEKGNIAQKEVIRLKAFLLTLSNERKELHSQIVEKIGKIALLTADTTSGYIVPHVETRLLDSLSVPPLTLTQLLDSAIAHRSDLMAHEAAARLEEQNLSLQQASGWPDLRLGFMYDRNASYMPEYTAITMEVDLPIFNRNQGSIEAAANRVESVKSSTSEYRQSVENEVRNALVRLRETEEMYRTFDSQFVLDFDALIEGIARSFERRNISLVEFIDFLDAYKTSIVQRNQIQSDRMKAFEGLNLATGTNIFGK